MRGLKYVVLGDCESNLIQTITLGTYESVHLPETKDHAVTEWDRLNRSGRNEGGSGAKRDSASLESAIPSGQYTEYPAAVQGWAQQALPGGRNAADVIQLSKNSIQHIKKHTFEGMSEQAKYLTDEQLADKIS